MLRIVHGNLIQDHEEIAADGNAYDLFYHQQLLDGFFLSHEIRNHSKKTLEKNKKFLLSWFHFYSNSGRPLTTWEAMRPIEGRKRVTEYGKKLLVAELSNQTIRTYLGTLKSYFDYVLQHPFVFDHSNRPIRLMGLYGHLEQPVSEYDIPQHSYDGSEKRLGVPFDPALLYDFYSLLRKHYLPGRQPHTRARNYAMVIVAGESGLRAEELRHLEIKKDLFFESKKIQTRYAKGSRGSGKRSRTTLFTPLARHTIQYYLKHHRPYIDNSLENDYLFPSPGKHKFISYPVMAQALNEMIEICNKKDFFISNNFSWHWLRRIFATRFIENFPNELQTLISLLGHNSLGTVHKYIQHSEAWMDNQIQNIIERVEKNEH